jgi:hypothetical protein
MYFDHPLFWLRITLTSLYAPVCFLYQSHADVDPSEDYHLYTEDNKLNPFQFKLVESSIAKYWATKNKKQLKFIFYDNVSENKGLAIKHNSSFAIEEIYKTQLDVVEELLHKKLAYSKSKQKELLKFKTLFPDKAILKRIIAGNYTEEEEINKRPMTKFTQDIARQLGLLKD